MNILLILIITIISIVIFFIVKKIKEANRISRNLNKIQKPEKLKTTLEKIWLENKDKINKEEIANTQKWVEEMMIKIDKEEIKSLADIQKSLNEQKFSKKP
jgi:hypothetical protein